MGWLVRENSLLKHVYNKHPAWITTLVKTFSSEPHQQMTTTRWQITLVNTTRKQLVRFEMQASVARVWNILIFRLSQKKLWQIFFKETNF